MNLSQSPRCHTYGLEISQLRIALYEKGSGMKNVDKENIKTQEIKGKERTTITAKPKEKI